jgi:hypothetical protein
LTIGGYFSYNLKILFGTVLRRALGHASLNAVCAMIVDLIDPQRLDNAARHTAVPQRCKNVILDVLANVIRW